MRQRLTTKFLAAAVLLATASVAAAFYRFDDVYGPSGKGEQWMVVTTNADTGGSPAALAPMDTEANLVNNRDSVYITNGDGLTASVGGWGIHTLFLVIPDIKGDLWVSFDWVPPLPPGTQDVLVDNGSYSVMKTPLTTSGISDKLFQLTFNKTVNASEYGSVRGNFIFHQNPSGLPSQTLQVPFIIANVYKGTAVGKPLLFRAVMRETGSAATGDIVAFDRFQWTVTDDLTTGSDGDWVFVPIAKLPIDSNVLNYRLVTEIVNYTGIRYAMQRYDGFVWNPMFPSRWAFDIPAVGDIPPSIYLDELSHIPPGLVTTYSQSFNVVSGVKEMMHVYPVDPASGFRNLTLTHRSVLGLTLGTAKDAASPPSYFVTGFQLLAAGTDFLQNVGAVMGLKNVKMPEPSDGVMAGSAGYAYVAADAIGSFAVNAPVPSSMSGANGAGLLPLHVTFNLPRANRLVAPHWDALLKEWRDTGNIRTPFVTNFSVYLRDAYGYNLDLINWLKSQNAFDKTVKIFLDEQRGVITVSFIAMLTDGPSSSVRLVRDVTGTSDNTYIVVMDGNSNKRWDMTFFAAPAGYVPTNEKKNDGGSGGCQAATGVLLPLCVFAFLKRRQS